MEGRGKAQDRGEDRPRNEEEQDRGGEEGKETEELPLRGSMWCGHCYHPPHPQGLSASLAADLLLRDGPNALRPPRGTPEYVKFARQLAGGLQCLMWVAAAICLIAFAIQASEGDLTTDDNVSGGCCRDTGIWRIEDIEHGLRTRGTQDGDTETWKCSQDMGHGG